MAFPTTAVLDTFNRANEDPCSGGGIWTTTAGTILGGFGIRLAVVGNEAFAGSYAASFFIGSYGPDVEAWATEGGVGTSTIYLFVRVTDISGSAADCYAVYFDFNLNDVQVHRYDNGTPTQLGAAISQTLDAGDSVGVEMVGSTISLYRKPAAGAWDGSPFATRSDGTYTGAGQIALGHAPSSEVTEFGGGTYSGGGGGILPQATHYYQHLNG